MDLPEACGIKEEVVGVCHGEGGLVTAPREDAGGDEKFANGQAGDGAVAAVGRTDRSGVCDRD